MIKFREWLSIQVAKHPKRVVLVLIILFNVLFITASAALISSLSLHGTEKMNFFHAAYYTVTMILDAGCIESSTISFTAIIRRRLLLWLNRAAMK